MIIIPEIGKMMAESEIQPDQTAAKLKSVLIPLPEHAKVQSRSSLLIFAEPGAEPTEHLLQELLELKDAYRSGGWPVQLLIRKCEQEENATFVRDLQELIGCTSGYYQPIEHYCVQSTMGIGDARLPLAVVLDGQGRGVYGCANYNIRSEHTMLRILQMME